MTKFNVEVEGREVRIIPYDGYLDVPGGQYIVLERHQARDLAAALSTATTWNVEEIGDED